MRLLNSIHDEIGNRSCACWFCFDFSLEIAAQTNRSKSMCKGKRRKEVCRLFGRQKHMYIATWHRNYRQVLNLHDTAEKRKIAYRQNITAVVQYRRTNTAIFWFYRFRQSHYRRK